MYGAIIGDCIGSIWEYLEFLDSKNKVINKERRFNSSNDEKLLKESCFYSDDTILTMAVLNSIINKVNYEESIKKFALDRSLYRVIEGGFPTPFSARFLRWCEGKEVNDSFGNGAAMRVSPVGYLFDNIDLVLKEAEKCTVTSHNTKEAIEGAQAIASTIFLARNKYNKAQIKDYLENKFSYNLNFDLEKLHNEYMFSSITKYSIPQALYIFLISNGFEDAMRKCLYIGGDTDTIACMVGSMCEAYYGIDDKFIKEVNKKIPNEFIKLLDKGYNMLKSRSK